MKLAGQRLTDERTRVKHIVIFYNDAPDSDNLASALAILQAFSQRQNTKIVFIQEPRQVSFGLAMTQEERERCLKLIKTHFHQLGPPHKVLLGGLLKQSHIDGNKDLLTSDCKMLARALRPELGTTEDAKLHAYLAAWDQAASMYQSSVGFSIQILVDLESLKTLQSPVNPNMHLPDELFARSQEEIEEFNKIMARPELNTRVEGIRKWYLECTENTKKRPENYKNSVEALNLESLCDLIKNAKRVDFFGGASLDILRRLLVKRVTQNIKCHLQVGTYDLSGNLFPLQFNVALNPEAATFVFDHCHEFKEFTVVASQTAKNVKYWPSGLEHDMPELAKKILGYNHRENPLDIAKGRATLSLERFRQALPMPDLTMVLLHLRPDLIKSQTRFVQVSSLTDGFLFKRTKSGVMSHEVEDEVTLDLTMPEIFDAMASDKRRTAILLARFRRFCLGSSRSFF